MLFLLYLIFTKISKKNWTFYGKNKKQKESPAFFIELDYLTHSPFPLTVYPPTVVLTARAPEPST